MYYQLSTKYVCGIDLHAKTMSACVMDREGRILKKRSLPCQVGDLMEFLHPWGRDITVGVESTYNWYWLIDALKNVCAVEIDEPCIAKCRKFLEQEISILSPKLIICVGRTPEKVLKKWLSVNLPD